MLPRLVTRATIVIVGLLLFGSVPEASASSVVGGGIDIGGACVDGSPSCPAAEDFELSGLGAATGTIDVTFGGLFPAPSSVDIDVDVASLLMIDTAGAIDGVDSILFTNLTFDVVGFSAPYFGGPALTGPGPVLGTVTGTYEQFLGAAPVVGATDFSQVVSFGNLSCSTTGIGNCGFSVSTTDSVAFPGLHLDVGTTGGGTDYLVQWTFNVAIPEPSVATLLGLGLVVFGCVRRRRV